jgi:hypothetical protein
MGEGLKIALYGGYCQALSPDFVPIIVDEKSLPSAETKESAVRL